MCSRTRDQMKGKLIIEMSRNLYHLSLTRTSDLISHLQASPAWLKWIESVWSKMITRRRGRSYSLLSDGWRQYSTSMMFQWYLGWFFGFISIEWENCYVREELKVLSSQLRFCSLVHVLELENSTTTAVECDLSFAWLINIPILYTRPQQLSYF